MDRFLMQYPNNKYALTLRKSVKKVILEFQWPVATPKCFGLGNKLAYDVVYRPALLKLNR